MEGINKSKKLLSGVDGSRVEHNNRTSATMRNLDGLSDSHRAFDATNPVGQNRSGIPSMRPSPSAMRILSATPLSSSVPFTSPLHSLLLSETVVGAATAPATKTMPPQLTTAAMPCHTPQQRLHVLPSTMHTDARLGATPAGSVRTTCGHRIYKDRSHFSLQQKRLAQPYADQANRVDHPATHLIQSKILWADGAHPTGIVHENEYTASQPSIRSGDSDSGAHENTCQLATPRRDPRPQSPMQNFHEMLSGSYDVPTLDAIFGSLSDRVEQERDKSTPIRAPTPIPMLAQQHLDKAYPAASRRPDPYTSNSADELPRRIDVGQATPSAATAAARMPEPPRPPSTRACDVFASPRHLPPEALAKRDRRTSAPTGDERPKEDAHMRERGQHVVQVREPLAEVRRITSPSSMKPNEVHPVSSMSHLPVSLESRSKTTTARYYSTASLAKTFDGAEYLNDYILLNEIGIGATGRVLLAFSTSMNKSVAIKIIPKSKDRRRPECRSPRAPSPSTPVHGCTSGQHSKERGTSIMRADAGAATTRHEIVQDSTSLRPPSRGRTQCSKARDLEREFDVMKDLNHPNIVHLYEVINDPKANELFLILQYVDSGAIAVLDSTGHIEAPLPPQELLPIAAQICDGLVYLHEKRIVHHDIKPENILVNRDGHAFLADFGVAEVMKAGASQPHSFTVAYQGTPMFMAPEIYGGDEDVFGIESASQAPSECNQCKSSDTDGRSSCLRNEPHSPQTIDPFALDVWALGVTLYTLLVGHVPFTTMRQIRQTVQQGVEIPTSLPEQWRTVLQRTMMPQQDSRISSTELRNMLQAMLAEQAAAKVQADEAGRKVTRGSRFGNIAHKSCTSTTGQCRSVNRSEGGVGLDVDMKEENVNMSVGSSICSARKSVYDNSGGPTTLMYSRDNVGERSSPLCDIFSPGPGITPSILEVLRPTNTQKAH